MTQLTQDLRFAFRRLRKNPGSTVTAVAILALGLGATTALYSVLHAVLLTPLPYPDAERIFRLLEVRRPAGEEEYGASADTFLEWRRGLASFPALAAIYFDNFNLTGAREPQQLRAAKVSRDFFTVFGPAPRPGRVFTEVEAGGSEPVVILGHGVWQRQFGGRDDAVGAVAELDGRPHRIVGVMPADFQFPPWADVWLPLGDKEASAGAQRDLLVYGLLGPDVDRAAAAAELEVMAQRLAAERPETHEDVGTKLRPLIEEEVGEVRATLLMLFGAVAGVLVIVCLNVAGLELARGLERRREMALRSALGSGRRRLVQQLLTESLALAAIGGAAGVVLAHWGFDLILALAPSGIPRLEAASLDTPALAFAVGATVLAGIAAGWLPALSASRFRLDEALKARGAQARPRRRLDPRGVLVVAQVALTVALLAAAGLLLGSLANLLTTDPGFDADQVLSVGLVLPPDLYTEPHQKVAFVDEVCRRLEGLPEVQRAAVGNSLPWSGFPGRTLAVEAARSKGIPSPFSGEAIEKVVSEGFFETLGVSLLAGRRLGPEDRGDDGVEAVLVNEALARRAWPDLGRPPLGERMEIAPPGREATAVEVVGVVADLRYDGLAEPVRPQLYRSYGRHPWGYFNFAVRAAAGEPEGLFGAVRRTVWEVDPDRPLFAETTAAARRAVDLERPSFGAVLLGGFAAAALLLAAVGIYGLMAFVVGRRSNEIALRMALGARRGAVRRMVLGQGMRLVALGLLLGTPTAFAAVRLLEGQLFGIEPGDPRVFLAVLAVVAGTAWLAVHLPASRASRVDPAAVLREE